MNKFSVYPMQKCSVNISDKPAAFHVGLILASLLRWCHAGFWFLFFFVLFFFDTTAAFVKPTVSPVFTGLLPEASAL